MNTVGLLESSDTEISDKPRYLLPWSMLNTRWLEVAAMTDISVCLQAISFLAGFSIRTNSQLVTDRVTQFCSELAQNITLILEICNIHATAFNPHANGMIEKTHRSIKVAFKASEKLWLSQLPVVLLDICL